LLGLSAPAAVAVAPAGEPASKITNPDWARKPSGDDIARYYPVEAMRKGLGGQATIRCLVRVDGHLENCLVVSESPEGVGFGAATLELAGEFRMTPQTRDGVPIGGASVTIPVVYKPPESEAYPTPEEMQKRVRESLRRTFTPTPADALGALGGLAGVLLLALLLDWPARGRRPGQIGAAAVIRSGLTFLGPFWARATLPALLYVAAAAGLQLAPYGPAELQLITLPAIVVVSVLGVLVMGAGWRLALADRGMAFRWPGLHFGKPELWSFIAPLVLFLITMVGTLFVGLAGVALWFIAGSIPALAAEREFGTWTFVGLAFGAIMALSARLWLLTPMSILRNELAFGEAWKATKGRMWPAVAGMLLLQLIMTGPAYALMYLAGRLPPIWSEPVFEAPWMMLTVLCMVITAGIGVPLMIGMKAALIPGAEQEGSRTFD
jgi:TonB family protein